MVRPGRQRPPPRQAGAAPARFPSRPGNSLESVILLATVSTGLTRRSGDWDPRPATGWTARPGLTTCPGPPGTTRSIIMTASRVTPRHQTPPDSVHSLKPGCSPSGSATAPWRWRAASSVPGPRTFPFGTLVGAGQPDLPAHPHLVRAETMTGGGHDHRGQPNRQPRDKPHRWCAGMAANPHQRRVRPFLKTAAYPE